MSWRPADSALEGLRTARHGRWLSLGVVVIAAALVGGTAVADLRFTADVAAAERDWEAAGGLVAVAQNEQAGVSTVGCERLNGVAAIEAAGAVTAVGVRAGTANAPDAALPVFLASPGLGRVLRTGEITHGALVPSGTAASLGLTVGSYLRVLPQPGQGDLATSGGPRETVSLPAAPVEVVSVAATSVLGPEHGSALFLASAASGRADQCWVRARPGQLTAVVAALPATLTAADPSAPTIVATRLGQGRFDRDFVAEFEQRSLRWGPWVGGLLLGALWWLLRWRTRDEDGLLTSLGASWTDRAVLRLVQWGALVGSALVVASVPVIVAGWLTIDLPIATALALTLRCVVVTVAVASSLALLHTLVPLRDPLAAMKDR